MIPELGQFLLVVAFVASLAQSTAPLDELEEALGLRLRTDEDDEEIDTLGGLVFLRTGRVPARGEVVDHESGAQIEIVDADA